MNKLLLKVVACAWMATAAIAVLPVAGFVLMVVVFVTITFWALNVLSDERFKEGFKKHPPPPQKTGVVSGVGDGPRPFGPLVARARPPIEEEPE